MSENILQRFWDYVGKNTITGALIIIALWLIPICTLIAPLCVLLTTGYATPILVILMNNVIYLSFVFINLVYAYLTTLVYANE